MKKQIQIITLDWIKNLPNTLKENSVIAQNYFKELEKKRIATLLSFKEKLKK